MTDSKIKETKKNNKTKLSLHSFPFKPKEGKASLPSHNKKVNRVEPLQIKVFQWNTRSLNTDLKLHFAKGVQCHIYCLQEIWKHDYNLDSLGTILAIKKRGKQTGVGTETVC